MTLNEHFRNIPNVSGVCSLSHVLVIGYRQTDRRTDGRTDKQTTYRGISYRIASVLKTQALKPLCTGSLCVASRGNNYLTRQPRYCMENRMYDAVVNFDTYRSSHCNGIGVVSLPSVFENTYFTFFSDIKNMTFYVF